MFSTKPYRILPFSKRQNYKTMNSYTNQMFDTSDSIQTVRYRSHYSKRKMSYAVMYEFSEECFHPNIGRNI